MTYVNDQGKEVTLISRNNENVKFITESGKVRTVPKSFFDREYKINLK